MEYCVTISPDPKKKIDRKEYGAMAPRKQYASLVYNISSICQRLRLLYKYKFVFEISANGNIHAHGIIVFEAVDNNLHAMQLKQFKECIAEKYGRTTNKQYYIDVCCKVKLRDDSIESEKYKTWDDYLNKEQKGLPRWMRPINSDNIIEIRQELEVIEYSRNEFMKQFKSKDLDAGILVDFE